MEHPGLVIQVDGGYIVEDGQGTWQMVGEDMVHLYLDMCH